MRPDLFTTGALEGGAQLRANGAELTADRLAAVAAELRAGAGPRAVHALTRIYRQGSRPNANGVRFGEECMASLAAAYVGKPVLKNHTEEVDAVVGRILETKLERELDGTVAIMAEIEITERQAMLGALEGRFKETSIGWRTDSAGDPECSACKAPMRSARCTHYPLDRLEGGAVVEGIFRKPIPVECSFVVNPAVAGAGVESVRLSLSAFRENLAKPVTELTMALAAEREAHGVTRAELGRVVGELAAARAEMFERDVDAIVLEAKRTGRLTQRLGPDSKPIRGGTPIEATLRNLAKHDLDAARQLVETLPRVTPVGAPLLSRGTAPPIESERARIDEQQKEINRRLGVSEEDFLKYALTTEEE